jgi:CubicO group peptidase (beta-lactamase class C family)
MIASLVEDGKLAWTSTPASIFPEHREAMNPQLREVTLQQLLSHHAGIRADTLLQDFDTLPPFTGTPKQQRLGYALRLLGDSPTVPVGAFRYSNGDYTVATAIAERVTGQSWETLMQERVFGKLGVRAVFGWPAAQHQRQPWGHLELGGQLVPHDPASQQVPTIIGPAGDVSMSIEDYATFVQTHLRGLRGRNRLLRASTVEYLHTPVGEGYALGWGLVPLDGVPTSVHDGSAGTFYATVAVQPSRDIAVVVIVNAASEAAATAVVEGALQLLSG